MTTAYRGRAGVRLNQSAHDALAGRDPTSLLAAAESDFARALEIHPEYADGLLGWGNLCMNRAEWKRRGGDPAPELRAAREHYARALRVNPESAELLMRRGVAHLMLAEYADAHRDLTAAVERNPSYDLREPIAQAAAGMRAKSDF
jgi:tetratricopeptide (TPR) repeat protein